MKRSEIVKGKCCICNKQATSLINNKFYCNRHYNFEKMDFQTINNMEKEKAKYKRRKKNDKHSPK